MMLEKLKKFRQEAYHLLGPAKDATFELMDAVLLSRSVYSQRPNYPSRQCSAVAGLLFTSLLKTVVPVDTS